MLESRVCLEDYLSSKDRQMFFLIGLLEGPNNLHVFKKRRSGSDFQRFSDL